jgi:hypothetical protein
MRRGRGAVHIGCGINVGALLGEALNRSCLVVAHPIINRSPPLRAGVGQTYQDQGRNGRRRRSGGAGQRRNIVQHWKAGLHWGGGGACSAGRCRDMHLLVGRWQGCSNDGGE